MQKLFVSFRSLLIELRDNTRSVAELDAGLFYLDCSRIHAFTPWKHESPSGDFNELNYLFSSADVAGQIHLRLVAALERAEKQDRIVWRAEEGVRDYHGLNKLLTAQGHRGVPLVDENHTYIIGANWRITKAVRAAGNDVVVVE